MTLTDTSFVRPAVAQMSVGGLSTEGYIILAWTGNDPQHSLNVIWNASHLPGSPYKKVTFWSYHSSAAPTLTIWHGSNLLLGWIDSAHHPNILPLSLATLTPGTLTTLTQFDALSDLNLGGDPLVLNWVTPMQHLTQAQSSDGVHFASTLGMTGSPQLSARAPSFVFATREGGPEYWWSWAGTDSAHIVNVQWTTHYPQWPNPDITKTLLPETAIGGPQIAFNAGFLIAWTGTDPAHHLNVAQFDGI